MMHEKIDSHALKITNTDYNNDQNDELEQNIRQSQLILQLASM